MLVTHPYPASGSQFNAMVTDFRRLAAAVGRKDRGERVLQDLSNTLARAKAKLRVERAGPARGDRDARAARPARPRSGCSRQNSQTADVVRRLGLRTAGPGTRATASRRSASRRSARVNGWLAFVYPPQFERQVSGITKTSAYKRLPVVKAKRVRTLGGTTWLFGGPRSTMLFADRLARVRSSRDDGAARGGVRARARRRCVARASPALPTSRRARATSARGRLERARPPRRVAQ